MGNHKPTGTIQNITITYNMTGVNYLFVGEAARPRLCYNCRKEGHLSRECPKNRIDRRAAGGGGNGRGGVKSRGRGDSRERCRSRPRSRSRSRSRSRHLSSTRQSSSNGRTVEWSKFSVRNGCICNRGMPSSKVPVTIPTSKVKKEAAAPPPVKTDHLHK